MWVYRCPKCGQEAPIVHDKMGYTVRCCGWVYFEPSGTSGVPSVGYQKARSKRTRKSVQPPGTRPLR